MKKLLLGFVFLGMISSTYAMNAERSDKKSANINYGVNIEALVTLAKLPDIADKMLENEQVQAQLPVLIKCLKRKKLRMSTQFKKQLTGWFSEENPENESPESTKELIEWAETTDPATLNRLLIQELVRNPHYSIDHLIVLQVLLNKGDKFWDEAKLENFKNAVNGNVEQINKQLNKHIKLCSKAKNGSETEDLTSKLSNILAGDITATREEFHQTVNNIIHRVDDMNKGTTDAVYFLMRSRLYEAKIAEQLPQNPQATQLTGNDVLAKKVDSLKERISENIEKLEKIESNFQENDNKIDNLQNQCDKICYKEWNLRRNSIEEISEKDDANSIKMNIVEQIEDTYPDFNNEELLEQINDPKSKVFSKMNEISKSDATNRGKIKQFKEAYNEYLNNYYEKIEEYLIKQIDRATEERDKKAATAAAKRFKLIIGIEEAKQRLLGLCAKNCKEEYKNFWNATAEDFGSGEHWSFVSDLINIRQEGINKYKNSNPFKVMQYLPEITSYFGSITYVQAVLIGINTYVSPAGSHIDDMKNRLIEFWINDFKEPIFDYEAIKVLTKDTENDDEEKIKE